MHVRSRAKALAFDTRNFRITITIIVLLALRLLLYAIVDRHVKVLAYDLCQWDCHWYLHTAEDGYDIQPRFDDAAFGQANWVNFPAFPILIRLASFDGHLSFLYAGYFVSNVALFIFIFITIKYFDLFGKCKNYFAVAIFMVSYPYSFYYSLVYSESLYAVFAMLSFYFFYRNKILSSSISASFLAATRVTGVLFTPIIVAACLNRLTSCWERKTVSFAKRFAFSAILPISIAPLGLFLYMTFLYLMMGDAYAFVHVQIAWDRVAENPITSLWEGLQRNDLKDAFSYAGHSEMFAALCGIAGLILSARLMIQKKYAEGWFLGSTILLALSQGLVAFPRYCLANPIFMTTLFEYIWTSGLRKFFSLIVMLLIFLQLLLISFWTHAYVSLI